MAIDLALIGFGEAASAFAASWPTQPNAVRAYDIKTDDPVFAERKRRDYAAAGVWGVHSPGAALEGADAVLSLVTADQALAACLSGASHLRRGAFWFDMNSVAPETKRAACRGMGATGIRYVDVAVMAPVHPAGAAVPLLLSGPDAADGAAVLAEIGFSTIRVIDGEIGRASSIKMIRSVMVKGIEALSAECVLAAMKADSLDDVIASLDATPLAGGWAARADYALDRMMLHGLRRAAEMEEVVKTLDALGTGSMMTRATVQRQREIGQLALPQAAGLAGKLAALLHRRRREAA